MLHVVLPHATYTNLYLVMLNLLHVNRPFSLIKQARARAFAELVMHVESALEDGIHVFKLAELHAAYENRLKNLNRTRLKGKLLYYFQDNGI